MTQYQYFKKNASKIAEMYKANLIPVARLNDFETYQYFLDCKDAGDNTTEAVSKCMSWFGISRAYVYLIIKKLETEVVK